VIAAVNGVVAGFSLDLVTEADIPIASDKATFVDPHVSLGYVSSHEMVNMARRVPVAVCLRMALLGSRERLSAERAYQVGLVTEVVPHARLMERARELAAMVVSNAPLAVWGTKMGILQGLGLPSRRPRRSPPATSRWSSRARITPRGRAPSSRSARPAGRRASGTLGALYLSPKYLGPPGNVRRQSRVRFGARKEVVRTGAVALQGK